MQDVIDFYELWRLEVPTGRELGDCKCRFNMMDFLILGLKTAQGRTGWGFTQTMSKGIFNNSAPWVSPLPALPQLQNEFLQHFWPLLRGNPLSLKLQRPNPFSGYGGMKQAIRFALWDLLAQMAEVPLYVLLGGNPSRDRIRAYGSGIDFPLSDEEAGELFKRFTQRGLTAVKVKVGSPDPARDLRRLQVVRQSVGDQVEIAIDANEAWTCAEAIQRIQFFEKEGVRLEYVEDPLPRTDVEGFARLHQSVDLDIAAHDYIVDDPVQVRRFMERKAFDRLRTSTDIDQAQEYAEIAAEFGIPMIVGNTVFEICVHAAVALPQTERIEFSDVSWNLIPRNPVRIENGYALAPAQPGHGLEPDPEQLKRYSRPEPHM